MKNNYEDVSLIIKFVDEIIIIELDSINDIERKYIKNKGYKLSNSLYPLFLNELFWV